MGTRAQFFIGNPMDLEGREWLGTIAWDGYPDGDCAMLAKASSDVGFRALVNHLRESRDDFCDPASHSFPFPWKGNLFLTDCTYALFDGKVHVTWFDQGFVPLADYLASEELQDKYHEQPKELPSDVPAPATKGPPGPDSIILVSV